MKRKSTILAMLALLHLLVVPFVAADVVVFQNYDTTMEYEDGSLKVTKELRLKNVGSSPIIPGEVHFKLSKDRDGEPVAPEVTGFEVTDRFGNDLDTSKHVSQDQVNLIFTIWDPLLPDFYYDMTMTYELEFKPKGILFYHVVLPEEKTTIPIKGATTTFELPAHYHITHASGDSEVGSSDGVTTATWDEKGNYDVEYSVIPFPRLGFRAVNAFWALIIVLFLLNLFYRMKKKARRG
ncbi:MAG: hypothetical protein ACLFO2_00830 [Candidatus Woesearchaeota archaeon]